MEQKRFALTGVGGYIAPRHLKAIRDTGNDLVAVCDPNDSVGIIDSYFPEASFFREYERFDRHLDKLRRKGEGIHYLSICSPNYLHDAHVRLALRLGADAICEKPLVINPWNIEALQELAEESGKKVYSVLQLRMHPAIIELRKKHEKENSGIKHDVELTYITSRGKWYLSSWKSDVDQSGGLATNIGIHFFDMLLWIFGSVQRSEVHVSTPCKTAGFMELERARVKWFLSIDRNDLPIEALDKKQTTFRSITIGGRNVEFSEGFTDLHTLVYQDILSGGGFEASACLPSIQLAYTIRNAVPAGVGHDSHPMLKR